MRPWACSPAQAPKKEKSLAIHSLMTWSFSYLLLSPFPLCLFIYLIIIIVVIIYSSEFLYYFLYIVVTMTPDKDNLQEERLTVAPGFRELQPILAEGRDGAIQQEHMSGSVHITARP